MEKVGEQLIPLAEYHIKKFRETPQNPRYHAEGNVRNHVLMVLKEYQKGIQQFSSLTEEEKTILYWSVFLHDIGKPAVTRKVEGKWSARGHEQAGIPIARDILLEKPEISAESRRKILDIVKWHHVPMRWGLAEYDLASYKLLSTATDLKLLGIFGLFDVAGRLCDSKDSVLGIVRTFNEQVAPYIINELGDYAEIERLHQFANLHKKNALWSVYQSGHSALLGKVLKLQVAEIEKPERHCVITIGAPNAGKTAWLKESYPDYSRLDLHPLGLNRTLGDDDVTMQVKLQHFRQQLQEKFKASDRVAIDGTNLNAAIRREICQTVRDMDAWISYLFFERSFESLAGRNAESDSPISEMELRQAWKAVDYPHPWEAHEVLFAE